MSELNDYELVLLAQEENNEDAINLIYQKYKPIIIKKSKHAIMLVRHHGIEINDLMQEGFIGLDEAIKNFVQDDDASFYTFANLCIDRKIFNCIRRANGGKDRILNEAVTIDDGIDNILADSSNLESSLIFKDIENTVIDVAKDILTNFEKEVFDLKIKGYSFEEIAKILDKDLKSIYNTFHRIKMKFRKNMKIDN